MQWGTVAKCVTVTRSVFLCCSRPLILLLLSAIQSFRPYPLPFYRSTLVHICSPLHLSRSQGPWGEQRSCLWSVECYSSKDPCSRNKLTRFWREDVSQLLNDLLELQHRVLLMLQIISCHKHTHTRIQAATENVTSRWKDKVLHLACMHMSSPHLSPAACHWPAASVSVVSLLAGSPWCPPPDTGEDRVDGSDPLASESSLGCFWERLITILSK